MKRMHYMAGAVGLAPAALGMAFTHAAANAATTSQAGHAKTVSLHHVLPTTARANTTAASSSTSASVPASASSSASTAASPATATGCKGNTWFHIPQNHDLKGHGWYTNESWLDTKTCIGTVDIWVKFTKNICKDVSLSASVPGSPWERTHIVCGTAGHSKMTQFNVHKIYTHPNHQDGVWVCAKSTYNTAGTCSQVGS